MKVRNDLMKILVGMAGLFLALSLIFALPTKVASANVDVDDVSITMMGAGVRMSGERAKAIRFRAGIDATEYATLSAGYTVEFGMLIIPKELLTGELTLDNENGDVEILNIVSEDALTYMEDGKVCYNAVVSNIPEEYYTQDILGRAYITLTKDADSKTFYSDVQTRNLAYVAHKELMTNGDLTTEQMTTLTEYKAGKTLYSVATENGIVLDYDYAWENQELDVKFDIPANKYLGKVNVNGNDSNFDWSTYKVTMPAENATVSGVLNDQADTPSVIGSADAAKYYVSNKQWGSISDDGADVYNCESTNISDEDWNALVAAGYKGNIVKGKVTSYVHPSRASRGGAANVSLGVGLGGLSMLDLYDSSTYNEVKDNYYISVWIKASNAYTIPAYLAAYDFTNLKQATGGDVLWLNTAPVVLANTWTELRWPVAALHSAWFYLLDNNGDMANTQFGIYCYHSNMADTTVQIYSAELMLNDIDVTADVESVDLTPYITNPYAPYTYVDSFEICDASGALTEGKDYMAVDYTVSGLASGDYKVVYHLASSTEHQGAFVAYPNGATVTRSLKVAELYTKSTVIGDMSNQNEVTVYTNDHGSARDVSSMTVATSTTGTITDDEYNALIAAGYVGGKSDKNVVKVTFPAVTARQDVYVQFNDTLTDSLFKKAFKVNPTDVYVSVWLKSDKNFNYHAFTGIIGQTTHYAATPYDIGWIASAATGDWIELKIPFASLHNTAWYVSNNYLNSDEEYAYGFVLDNCSFNGYISEATFSIYSIELAVESKTATAGAAQDLAISSDLYGTYTISILNSTGNDVTATCTVSGTSVTIPTAGTYTVVYTITSDNFVSNLTVKGKLTVSASE